MPYVVIDTGGLVENPVGIETQMRRQTERAVQEADRLIFIADVREGLTPADHFVVRELRKSGKPFTLVLNKAEGLDSEYVGVSRLSFARVRRADVDCGGTWGGLRRPDGAQCSPGSSHNPRKT